jgi:hypothetical protein
MRPHFQGSQDAVAGFKPVPQPVQAQMGGSVVCWLLPACSVRHMLFNGAVAGSTSPYMSSCLDRHLPPEQQEQIDLAFVGKCTAGLSAHLDMCTWVIWS